MDITNSIIDVHDFNLYCNKHTCTRVQDFELELAGAHVMRVQICSKSLLKEETYAHGKIRVCVVSPLFTVASLFPAKSLALPPGPFLFNEGMDSIKFLSFVNFI